MNGKVETETRTRDILAQKTLRISLNDRALHLKGYAQPAEADPDPEIEPIAEARTILRALGGDGADDEDSL